MTERSRVSNSINRKLARLVVVSVTSACVLMGGFGCWQELSRYSSAKKNELRAASSIFAAAASDAVAGHDRAVRHAGATRHHSASGYSYASVRDLDDVIIAEVGSGARPLARLMIVDGKDDVVAFRSILDRVPLDRRTGRSTMDRLVGRIQLVSGTAEVRSRLLSVALSALAGAGLALLLGIAISLQMQEP